MGEGQAALIPETVLTGSGSFGYDSPRNHWQAALRDTVGGAGGRWGAWKEGVPKKRFTRYSMHVGDRLVKALSRRSTSIWYFAALPVGPYSPDK